MRVFLGITGGSGAPYAARLLEALAAADCEIGVCASTPGIEVLATELYGDARLPRDETLARFVEPAAGAATIVFDGGTVVSYRGSWVSSGPATPWSGEWRIDCRDGEIAFASRGDAEAVIDRLTVRERGGEARPMTLPEIGPTGRAGVLAAFLEAVRTRAVPETDGRANLGTMALTHAAIASATTGEPQLVSVPDAA